MAFDPGLYAIMTADLAGRGMAERKMFGGVCFMDRGHMVCGLHKGGAMFRVGKAGQAAARAIPGTFAMDMAGRPMTGMVGADAALMADDARRGQLMALALAHAAGLPAK